MRSETEVARKITSIMGDIKVMQDYCDQKKRHQDWHGVADAAMDLRDLEAMALSLAWTLGSEDHLP